MTIYLLCALFNVVVISALGDVGSTPGLLLILLGPIGTLILLGALFLELIHRVFGWD